MGIAYSLSPITYPLSPSYGLFTIPPFPPAPLIAYSLFVCSMCVSLYTVYIQFGSMCVSLYDLRSFSDDLGLALGRLQSNLGMIQGKLGITLGKHIYTPLSLCVYAYI